MTSTAISGLPLWVGRCFFEFERDNLLGLYFCCWHSPFLFVGELISLLTVECPAVALGYFKVVGPKMESALEHFLDLEKEKSGDLTLSYLSWRNYLIGAVASCGTLKSQVIRVKERQARILNEEPNF